MCVSHQASAFHHRGHRLPRSERAGEAVLPRTQAPATMQEHMRKGERMLRGVESAESKRKKNLRRDAFLPLPATVAFLYFSHRRNKSNPKITD